MSIELLVLAAVTCAVIGGFVRQHQTNGEHPFNDGMALGALLGIVGLAIVLLTKPRPTKA